MLGARSQLHHLAGFTHEASAACNAIGRGRRNSDQTDSRRELVNDMRTHTSLFGCNPRLPHLAVSGRLVAYAATSSSAGVVVSACATAFLNPSKQRTLNATKYPPGYDDRLRSLDSRPSTYE